MMAIHGQRIGPRLRVKGQQVQRSTGYYVGVRTALTLYENLLKCEEGKQNSWERYIGSRSFYVNKVEVLAGW